MRIEAAEDETLDLLLKQARVNGQIVDIGIANGKIARVEPHVSKAAQRTLQLDGKVVIPGFVESHIHLDKAYVADRAPGLSRSTESPQALVAALKREFTVEDIYSRARRALQQSIRHGCTAMRAYIEIDPYVELRGVEAMQTLQRDFAEFIDLELVAFAQEGIYQDDATQGMLIEALEMGLPVLGGCPYMDPGREHEHIDWFFEIAQRHAVRLDFHADSGDQPSFLTSDYIASRTTDTQMQGQVQIGHLCVLDVLEPTHRALVIEQLRDNRIHVVSLPATESYVKGRRDDVRVWRGVTRIKELMLAGVNVAISTNNVVNPFTPYGHPDPLRQLLITALTAHLGDLEDLESIIDLATVNPAKALDIDNYGLSPGCEADLVVLDASSVSQAIIEQSEKCYVVKRGNILAESTRATTLSYPN